ncbi:MAG: hypothetical protein JO368_02880, partial [Acidimicrobiales bacterium]|nr:hypothetical protein [Acidimicrobiales bacterium]
MTEPSEQGADAPGTASSAASAPPAAPVTPPPSVPVPPSRAGMPPPPPPGRPPFAPPPFGPPVPQAGIAGTPPRKGSLGDQLAGGAAPRDRPAAWIWLVFAALGFLAGQILAGIFISVTAAIEGKSSSLAAIMQLSEPPTWYVASTL